MFVEIGLATTEKIFRSYLSKELVWNHYSLLKFNQFIVYIQSLLNNSKSFSYKRRYIQITSL